MKLSHSRTDGTTNTVENVKEVKEIQMFGERYLRIYLNELNEKGKNVYMDLEERLCKNLKIEF